MNDSRGLADESTNAPAVGAKRRDCGRVLVVFPGALGDLLLLAPAIATLVDRGVAVEVSVDRTLAPLASSVLGCPLGPVADGAAMSSLFGELAADLERWWCGASRLDVWLGPSAAADVSRHARTLGIPIARTHRVERDDGAPEHASVSYAAALDVDPPLVVPRLRPNAVSPYVWMVPDARRLVIHPGAGNPRKRWDRRGFLALADGWVRRGGEAVVLLGPVERDETDMWRRSGVSVVVGLDLLATAALLESAGTFVGNDSGIAHLAGIVRCRGVVLFGPTRPERWRPLGGALEPVSYSERAWVDVAATALRALAGESTA